MRTEDDLRTALTALERHAPAAARVLPGSGRPVSRGLRSPQATRWLAGVTMAAALAGVVMALILPGGTPGTIKNGGATSPGTPAMATLRAKLLAAISSARGDIVYWSSTSRSPGAPPIRSEKWAYPSQPGPGQLVRTRTVVFNNSGTPYEEWRYAFAMPAEANGSLGNTNGIKGEQIVLYYDSKSWYDQKDSAIMSNIPNGAARVVALIRTKHWAVSKTTLNGRAALELYSTAGDNSTYRLWADASTYLPLRETDTVPGPSGKIDTLTTDYEYLPATSANLAQLTPPIPAGFTKVAPPPSPKILRMQPGMSSPKPTAATVLP